MLASEGRLKFGDTSVILLSSIPKSLYRASLTFHSGPFMAMRLNIPSQAFIKAPTSEVT